MATGVQEIAIDQSEGDLLAKATADVLDQFDITPDPKTQAIIGLIMACGTVYGPRAYLYAARKGQEKQEQKSNIAGIYSADGMPQGTTTFNETK